MKKLVKFLVISLAVSLVVGLVASFAFAAKKELTPYEWNQMKPEDKIKYKKIVVRVYTENSSQLYLEKDQLPGPLTLKEYVDTGDRSIPREWYSKALFETLHPRVEIKYMEAPPYGPEYNKVLQTKILAGEGPAYYSDWAVGAMQYLIDVGLAADITDLVKTLPFYENIKKNYWGIWSECWKNGRCYGLFNLPCEMGIQYRKDWFKEAGIFDESGEPGPSYNWTTTDFRNICKKFTDPKKKRWGFAYGTSDLYAKVQQVMYSIAFSFGSLHPRYPLAVPDKSGKYTWRAEPDQGLAKALQFMNDLMFKDKTLISGTEMEQIFGPHREFSAGRCAMSFIHNEQSLCRILEEPYLISPTIPAKELVAHTLVPKGPYGMRLSTVNSDLQAFDPLLNKEELKAAFDWYCWINYSRGLQLRYMERLDSKNVLGAGWAWTLAQHFLAKPAFNVPEPAGMPPDEEMLPSIYLKEWDRALKVPAEPKDYEFKVPIIGGPDEGRIMSGLFQAAISNPNFDAQTEMKKACDRLNSTIYNYKTGKEDKENFKKYAAALVSFYKEYYPEFAKTTQFEEEMAKWQF